MLTVVALALAALSVRAAVRLWLHRPTSRAFGVVALVGWLLLTAWASGVEARHQITQAWATRMVRVVTDDPSSRAHCARGAVELFDLSGYAGHVDWDRPTLAQLRASTCGDLASWLVSSKRDPSLEQIIAVHVVVHEAEHVRGLRNESHAECAALADEVGVAMQFGASREVAERMHRRYVTEVYPYLSEEYLGSCR